ncbi:sugar phosphate isomerase/epimerase family protein [Cohnella fermenti]|uniref:Sugar phosphate isomerase/epimerase n=1 Tax=Cohnella fermenti TaxID=2565925 RepID=A0A4S4BMU1_9BACL|nr:sugar phosphate isomerase/epimerase family protein [Cohnella fermenti]THF75228.1 sugar phosphate isomerase/epimerase [Cohnella fermenti]
MRLGMIAKAEETSFRMAQKYGLDFVEFCVNEGDDVEEFCRQASRYGEWSREYGISIGSIGRWKSLRLHEDGSIIQEELERCRHLIDAASMLGCPNMVVGCNYVEKLSLYANCTSAIAFFEKLLDYAANRNVSLSSYNCRKVNYVNNPTMWSIIHEHLPELGIKYDPSHARFFEGDYLQETLNWGHRFKHVHLKGSLVVGGRKIDEPPAGLDQTDWRSFLGLLRACGYEGGLSIEPRKSALPDELAARGIEYSAAYFRRLLLQQEDHRS